MRGGVVTIISWIVMKNCCGKCEFLSNETRQKTSDQMTFDYRFEYQMYASDGLRDRNTDPWCAVQLATQ